LRRPLECPRIAESGARRRPLSVASQTWNLNAVGGRNSEESTRCGPRGRKEADFAATV